LLPPHRLNAWHQERSAEAVCRSENAGTCLPTLEPRLTSGTVARSLPRRVRLNTSPDRCGSTHTSRAGRGSHGHVRTRISHRLAHASAGADIASYLRLRMGAAGRRPKEEIRSGDIVWFPAGEKHWHGATATTGMSHVAIAESLPVKTVDWMEQVSDKNYLA
jgi:hypothetical protein